MFRKLALSLSDVRFALPLVVVAAFALPMNPAVAVVVPCSSNVCDGGYNFDATPAAVDFADSMFRIENDSVTDWMVNNTDFSVQQLGLGAPFVDTENGNVFLSGFISLVELFGNISLLEFDIPPSNLFDLTDPFGNISTNSYTVTVKATEPTTLMLLGVGLAGLSFTARRRRAV